MLAGLDQEIDGAAVVTVKLPGTYEIEFPFNWLYVDDRDIAGVSVPFEIGKTCVL